MPVEAGDRGGERGGGCRRIRDRACLRHHRGGGSCGRSEEHTSELQSLMRISYAVFCLKKKKRTTTDNIRQPNSLSHNTHISTLIHDSSPTIVDTTSKINDSISS